MQKVVDGTSNLVDAVSTYSEEVVKRGANEVLISKQNALMLLDWDQLKDSPIFTRSLNKSELSNS